MLDSTRSTKREANNQDSRPYERRRQPPSELSADSLPHSARELGVDQQEGVHYFSSTRWRVYVIQDGALSQVINIPPGKIENHISNVQEDSGWKSIQYSSYGPIVDTAAKLTGIELDDIES